MVDLYNQLVSDTPIQYGQVEQNEWMNNPLNDVAVDVTWDYTPFGLGTYNGLKWFNGIRPFIKDIWNGRNLFFRKPYNWMTKAERNQYADKGIEYFKNNLVKKPVNTKFGKFTFYGNRASETNPRFMNQFPFVRYNLSKAKKNIPTPNYKPDIRSNTDRFNNLEVNFLGKKYIYQGRYNKNYKNNDLYNIKEYNNFMNDIETKLKKDTELYQKYLDMQNK